jgi:hypothetical protein
VHAIGADGTRELRVGQDQRRDPGLLGAIHERPAGRRIQRLAGGGNDQRGSQLCCGQGRRQPLGRGRPCLDHGIELAARALVRHAPSGSLSKVHPALSLSEGIGAKKRLSAASDVTAGTLSPGRAPDG